MNLDKYMDKVMKKATQMPLLDSDEKNIFELTDLLSLKDRKAIGSHINEMGRLFAE